METMIVLKIEFKTPERVGTSLTVLCSFDGLREKRERKKEIDWTAEGVGGYGGGGDGRSGEGRDQR